ncbi:MAG: putative sugar nucleotidyl transferase [Planctomycetota bacterium]|jgi:UDP-N-acetylglucosamine diphosphorylase/glucosamine-1-phosphate N-acetyltransferase
MSSIVIFEERQASGWYPLTYTRHAGSMLVGTRSLTRRMADQLQRPVTGLWTRPWLAELVAEQSTVEVNGLAQAGTMLVNANWITDETPDIPAAPAVGKVGESIAFVVCDGHMANINPDSDLSGYQTVATCGEILKHPWDAIKRLKKTLDEDARHFDGESTILPCNVDDTQRVYVREGCTIDPTVVIRTNEGPVMIDTDACIGPHCVIEGPAYIGEATRLNPFTHLHGGNAIGPHCKLGGEIDGCIIQGYTNKQHFGFLGHSYVGSWVNIGAGATNSDLKNTYGNVRVPLTGTPVDTDTMFFGAVIGDHVKMGINATIPTGCWCGLASQLAGTSALPKYIPSFKWINSDRQEDADPGKLLATAATVMKRRNVELTPTQERHFRKMVELSRKIEE